MIEPVFKWPGSKRWMGNLAHALGQLVTGRVVEPFSGSAAFFLNSRVKTALLGDVNAELVECLIGLRDAPTEVIYRLKSLKNDRCHFDQIKVLNFGNSADKAARLIFLLNTCWGGIYRENLKGEFNVPFGENGRKFYDESRILDTSSRLKGADIRCQSYSVTLDGVVGEDLIILDPPYVVPEISHFDRYHRDKFTWDDQIRLSEQFKLAKFKGALAVMAAAESKSLYSLFPDWGVVRVQRRASLTSVSGFTGTRSEALLFSPALVERLNTRCVKLENLIGKMLTSPKPSFPQGISSVGMPMSP
jgi:DNA adenine methylase